MYRVENLEIPMESVNGYKRYRLVTGAGKLVCMFTEDELLVLLESIMSFDFGDNFQPYVSAVLNPVVVDPVLSDTGESVPDQQSLDEEVGETVLDEMCIKRPDPGDLYSSELKARIAERDENLDTVEVDDFDYNRPIYYQIGDEVYFKRLLDVLLYIGLIGSGDTEDYFSKLNIIRDSGFTGNVYLKIYSYCIVISLHDDCDPSDYQVVECIDDVLSYINNNPGFADFVRSLAKDSIKDSQSPAKVIPIREGVVENQVDKNKQIEVLETLKVLAVNLKTMNGIVSKLIDNI